MIKKEFYFPSVSGLADIHAASFMPEEKEVKAMTEDKVKGWVDYLNNEVAAEFGADKVALKEKGKNKRNKWRA